MPNKLYNILVPVNFTGRNKWAIAKAIEIANNFDCNIHFVSIVQQNIIPLLPVESNIFTPYESHADRLYYYERLRELSSKYSSQLCGNGKIEISVLEGNLEEKLVEYIRDFDMDMVIVGLSKFNLAQRILSSVSISRLTRRTDVPVLAVRASGLVCHFKKIILPLHNEVSLQKVKMATMLARTFKSTIYMITLRREDNSSEKIINDGLQMMQALSTIPVQGIILEGKNLAKTTLDFARKINADLIMINPIKEFNLPGWWNRFTNKLLSYGSRIPVITMNKQ
ncbi:MAG TPA: universal stress protein [Chitinophagaceae bacterium]|nr:universal stress protein [Chitinophagaceae bacterium]